MTVKTVPAEKAAADIAGDILKAENDIETYIGYLFVFGAGASYSCDIPLAGDIVNDLTKELQAEGRWEGIENMDVQVRDYQWVMTHYNIKEQAEIVRRYIRRARASDGRWKLNHCYLVLSDIWKRYPKYPRTLLTTNFDPLFYYALLEQNIEAKLIRYFTEMQHMLPFDTDRFPAIIHLHGYWQNHHLYNDVDSWVAYRKEWVAELAPRLLPFGLVVLGYSGHREDIVMQTLMNIRDKNTRISGNIYWCHLAGCQINNETYAVLDQLGNVVLVPIKDADNFMLQIGERLKLPQVIKIGAFASILKPQKPGFIQEFRSNADIRVGVHPRDNVPSDRDITIRIGTHSGYEKPGENYAGINIYPIRRLFDFSTHSYVALEYDAILSKGKDYGSGEFEFKLQSTESSHIENIPIGVNQAITLPLTLFSQEGVNLGAVDHIVIAANCAQIGCGSQLEIKLKEIRFS